MGKQLLHVSNQQQIFKKDKMNYSSGVMSPRRLFFGLCFLIQNAIPIKYGVTD
jgi:hypothetical protein